MTEETNGELSDAQKEYVKALQAEVMKIFETVKQEVGAKDIELDIQVQEERND